MANIFSKVKAKTRNVRFQWLLFALVPFFVLSCVAVGLIVHHVGVSDVSDPAPEPEAEPEPQTKVGVTRKLKNTKCFIPGDRRAVTRTP